MIFLEVRLLNLCGFRDTSLDLTYKKKLTNSTIPHEWVEGFNKINVKRAVVLSGPNASGKSTFARIFCNICNYLSGGPISNENPEDLLNFKNFLSQGKKQSGFDVEFIDDDFIYRLEARFDLEGLVSEDVYRFPLRESYNLDATREMLLRSANRISEFRRDNPNEDQFIVSPGFLSFAHLANKLKPTELCWNFLFPKYRDTNDDSYIRTRLNQDTANKVLQLFDPSINGISDLNTDNNDYSINFRNGDRVTVVKADVVDADRRRLSTGTLEAIHLLPFICNLISSEGGCTYFLDEGMAYSHSMVERYVLTTLIEHLSPRSQVFYTTHNFDIMDLDLPLHSYVFTKKDRENGCVFVHPEKSGYVNKNDRNLVSNIWNDVFDTLPEFDEMQELA